ncbi:hypothetical protein P4C99_20315 [Pontiellaceae bacterium B1224]|nr:hypothetical protein [Pontiellaceae bacterium B1224]
MNIIIILFLLVFLRVSHAFGGGSVSFDQQLLPILKQDKTFSVALLNSFEFNRSVYAQSDFGNHTMFDGERLGPYTLLAKPKGSESTWVFEVTIHTKWTIYDRDGNVIPLKDETGKTTGIFDPKAIRIEETFEILELKPYKETDSNPSSEVVRKLQI